MCTPPHTHKRKEKERTSRNIFFRGKFCEPIPNKQSISKFTLDVFRHLSLGPMELLTIYMTIWSPGWDIPREPGIQAPPKCSGSHKMFAVIHAVLVRIWLQGISAFPVKWRNSSYHTQHAGIFSCHMKKHLGTWNNLLPQEEISFHRKDFFPRTDISVTGRNFLSQKEIYCQRKKFN